MPIIEEKKMETCIKKKLASKVEFKKKELAELLTNQNAINLLL